MVDKKFAKLKSYSIYIAVPSVISYFVLFLSLAVSGHSLVDCKHSAKRFIGGGGGGGFGYKYLICNRTTFYA